MSVGKEKVSRRSMVKLSGALGAAGLSSCSPFTDSASGDSRSVGPLAERIADTKFVDTHEHLLDEGIRIEGKHKRIGANDWSFVLSHYLNSDLITSGMPKEESDKFFSAEVDPIEKWSILEPYWPRVRHTGYGQAVEIACRALYGVERIGTESVRQIQDGYVKTVSPGFYRRILESTAGIESCHVNSLEIPFLETNDPTFLMQDLGILGMHMGPRIDDYAPAAGIEVHDLQDWHSVIDWWFKKYGPYAVAVKSQAAYSRNIDYSRVPPEKAEKPFQKQLTGERLKPSEQKDLEDHLFWYCVDKATEMDLPVKIHTGYYAGYNRIPLTRLQGNSGAASDLCKKARSTRFVFMHINYPYYEDLVALAKQFTNCYVDMCWAWIISPTASVDFLRHLLVTAPSNKVLPFGGDYVPVEPVVGHATLARRGLLNALTSLVDEGWLDLDSAISLVEPIMRGNAHALFNLEKKQRLLKDAPWV